MKTRLALLLLFALLALPVLTAVAAEEAPEEHAEESGTAELVFKWLNFLVVFGGGAYFGADFFRKKFAEMRRGIQSQIGEARRQREESQARLREIEKRLAGLADEIESLRQEAVESAAAERRRIQETARREAARLLATTRAEIESAGRAARLELRAYAARLAVTLAEQRIRQQLTPQAQAALFEASLGHLAAPPANPPASAAGGRA